MADPRDTPAMRQFYAFKREHPDCVVFFRMGDFYETFDDDAVVLSKALGLTLTQRSAGLPMAGVPYHQRDVYLRKALAAGFRVAVVDQVQDPKEAKGLVARAVTQVVTPGTLVDEMLIADDAPVHLAAVVFTESGDQSSAGVAVIELASGSFVVFDAPAETLVDELARWSPQELLYADPGSGEPPPRARRVLEALSISGTPRPGWHFRREEALQAVLDQFGVATLAGFGLSEEDQSLGAAGAVIRYLQETQLPSGRVAGGDGQMHASGGDEVGNGILRLRTSSTLAHLRPPRRENPREYCTIDAVSLRALEIERTIRTLSLEGSLLGVFLSGRMCCRTSMGKRQLREWLKRPLADIALVQSRQSGVATLVEDRRAAEELGEALRGVQDVARIAGRIALGRATPRDLVGLGESLSRLREIGSALEHLPAFGMHLARLESHAVFLSGLAETIRKQCVDDPPGHLREGGLIRDGVDVELDEARGLQRDGSTWLSAYQARLIAEHDLPSLKVGFNSVFGYYIELPSAQARRAPTAFTRKQTLKNAERYITPELKTFEDQVLTAEARAIEREHAIFKSLCERACELVSRIGAFADVVAEVDATLALADKASAHRWVRPEIVEDAVLRIEGGRHPVLDESLAGSFVPNDVVLGRPDSESHETAARCALITGPNMAGKSTFIRQTALITILALVGSYVPADRAVIGICDRIFTRVGADDALHQGQSTFMVEMIETANILNHATSRSLVILDEIGRGTSTLDGLSLAWAIAEFLAAKRCRTLFATHYHELTQLEEQLPGAVQNLHVFVREVGDEIVFMHRIMPGRSDRSYGVHVARLAGVPRGVIERAKEILGSLSLQHGVMGRPEAAHGQLDLFTEYLDHPVVQSLRTLDLEALSPMQAFDVLRELRERVKMS